MSTMDPTQFNDQMERLQQQDEELEAQEQQAAAEGNTQQVAEDQAEQEQVGAEMAQLNAEEFGESSGSGGGDKPGNHPALD